MVSTIIQAIKTKIALTLQYLGGNYVGYQKQKNLPSIQEEVENALYTILGEQICIHAAGRTDTGVHAIGQVIHFLLTPKHIHKITNHKQFIYSLNSVLPKDISITHMAKVPMKFHARFSCIAREYVYRISNHTFKPAAYQNYYWTHKPIDIQAIKQATPYLLGEHDFAAFTKAYYKTIGQNTTRRMDEIRVEKKNFLVFFYYRGSGFLHNMLRIITGTLLDVGHHHLRPEDIKSILDNKDRRLGRKTLPPYALFFLNAIYNDYETPQELISMYGI